MTGAGLFGIAMALLICGVGFNRMADEMNRIRRILDCVGVEVMKALERQR